MTKRPQVFNYYACCWLPFCFIFTILQRFMANIRYRYIHSLAALFLIVGMTVQFVVAYRQCRRHVQESIDLKMQIAHQKVVFELYDAYEAVQQMEGVVANHLSKPDLLLGETRSVLKQYPSFFSCYAAFPEYYYPEKGKWFCPCSYRLKDDILTIRFGDKNHDYFTREWYKGALESGEQGFWSQPYRDEDFDETIFTHSDNMVDKEGNLICVIALDFSLSWLQQMLETYKPFDKAVCMLYSSNGTLLTSSENLNGIESSRLTEDHWILSRQMLNPVDIEMVIAVPKRYIWERIRMGIILPFFIFVLGIFVVAFLVRRILVHQHARALLETEKEVMARELDIAHSIQMGIVRRDFPNDDEVEVHADLLPMKEVGGDLYDFCRKGDVLWFIIGDVSGKGVPAAIFMSATVNLFRSALGHSSSPKAIMEEMNAVISENNPSLTFVTAFIGCLHVTSGKLQYCNAGHNKPILTKSGILPVKANMPLGFNGDYQFEEQSCEIADGEMLVLYTDGVTEARNSQREMMGMDRWVEMVMQGGDLLKAVQEYMGPAEPVDDITLMTICKKKK